MICCSTHPCEYWWCTDQQRKTTQNKKNTYLANTGKDTSNESLNNGESENIVEIASRIKVSMWFYSNATVDTSGVYPSASHECTSVLT